MDTLPERKKNQVIFLSFVPDDHSRVKLNHNAEKDGKTGDYINASYVDVSVMRTHFSVFIVRY